MNIKNKKIEEVLNNQILPFVLKPGRYVGNEFNIVLKEKDHLSARVALAFPEVYEIAMSYVGFDILYHVLNKEDDIWAERVYAPWTDMEQRMRKAGLPLYALESFTPLKEFDLVGFTLQYELTYTNVLNMLDLSGIPVWQKERSNSDPILLAGGPCTCNPEPMADFFDAFLIGDGEETVVEIARIVGQARRAGKDREEILAQLSALRGVYVPSFYSALYDTEGRFRQIKKKRSQAALPVQTRILERLKAEHYPNKPLVPLLEVTHNRLSIEVMRGCTEGCRFCNAGMIYRPTRERDKREIVQQMLNGLQGSGYEEVSFLSLSISDYSDLSPLMQESRAALDGKKVNVSFPSMRLDSFSPEIADFISTVRKSGFTFAPEAGSERLRRVINKNISAQDLERAVRIALENGWKHLKFYFMIGLPTETKEDIENIADLIENVAQLSKAFGKVSFTVSISPFSPKAHTPFQWERQNTREELLEKVYLLKEKFAGMRRVKLNWRDPDVSFIECVLGRADRKMAGVIFNAWKGGAIFDGWTEYFNMQVWQQAAQAENLYLKDYAQEFPVELSLPWEHIDKGVTKNFLLRERKNAFAEISEVDCKDGTCYACGIQRKNGFRELTDCYTHLDLLKKPPVQEEKREYRTYKKATLPAKSEQKTVRFRLQYEKKDYCRYISHLDLIRIFERVCRRADIPLSFSQGFNPHPRLSFGPPLSLGFSSEAEYLDMEIDAAYDKNLAESMNAFLPKGLKILARKEIKSKVQSLSAAINQSEYLVSLPQKAPMADSFEGALRQLLDAENIDIERKVKGKLKTINIRPYIESIITENNRLHIKTRVIDNRTVRISEIIKQLFQDAEINNSFLHVHRLKQLVHDGQKARTPLEILL